jgi:hypothetical protein
MLRDASQRGSVVEAPSPASRCDAPQHEGGGSRAFWRNEANGVLADEATGKNQPAAARNGRRLRTIVSGLLFTMICATCARTGTATDFGETNATRILAKRSQRDFGESNFVLAERKSS